MSAFAADNTPLVPLRPVKHRPRRPLPRNRVLLSSRHKLLLEAASPETGKAAGIDTAFAASAGGITATVLAVGAAAVVIGVALSDSGGGDDPAPPVTAHRLNEYFYPGYLERYIEKYYAKKAWPECRPNQAFSRI